MQLIPWRLAERIYFGDLKPQEADRQLREFFAKIRENKKAREKRDE